jgi:2-C-methyl-D-erythritol 4-phosphate cytidylyltransferase
VPHSLAGTPIIFAACDHSERRPSLVPRFHALIPAAGAGTRVGGETPKQYLPLAGKAMLAHAIDALLAEPRIASVLVVVGAADMRWPAVAAAVGADRKHSVEFATIGGATRFDSVRNGLAALVSRADAEDWVLVHDAARPCVSADELSSLIGTLQGDDVGGLLALPLTDTIKRAHAGRVERTLARDGLWRALTPQMFRLALLRRACDAAAATDESEPPTDEAMAIERLGLQPRLVPGAATNIKVTHEADLALAEAIFRSRAAPANGGERA